MCFISEILFFPSLLKAHQISTIDRPPRKLHEPRNSLAWMNSLHAQGHFLGHELRTPLCTSFKWSQCFSRYFSAWMNYGVLISTLNLRHSTIEENKKTPTHFAHFFSIVLNYYQPMFVQRTCDKRWPIVNSPRPRTQGSHTALRPHSIWRKVRRKCLEETVKGIETKIFSVDQAFWIWWTSKLSSEKRSHLHKKLTLTISSPSIFKSEINTPGTSSIFVFHLNKPTRSTVNNEKLVEHMLIKKVNFIATGLPIQLKG